jgi:SAM-dependent methyltransferase
MPNDNSPYPRFDHDEHARSCAPDDFLGQTRRTVQGKPVPQEQIDMIVNAVRTKLDIREDDTLLELACGNGYVSRLLFDSCREYLGVDFSEYLISVAKQHFERPPYYLFKMQGAAEYTREEPHPDRFTKALCYASFCYFPKPDAVETLHKLHDRFTNLKKVLIGNLPDRSRASDFYKNHTPNEMELADWSTAIGTWHTPQEFTHMAEDAGWKVQISTMPPEFFSSYYRFDALLTR